MNSLHQTNPQSFLDSLQEYTADMVFLDLSKSNPSDWHILVHRSLDIVKTSQPVLVLAPQTQYNESLILEFSDYLHGFHYVAIRNAFSLTYYDLYLFASKPYHDVADIKSVYRFRKEKQIELHQKPYEFYRDIIVSYSKPKDVLVDPLMGRGSFLSAAIRQERHYIGCEQDSINYMIANNLITSTEIKCHRLTNLKYYPMYPAM